MGDSGPRLWVQTFVAATLATIILRLLSLFLESAALSQSFLRSSAVPQYLVIIIIGLLGYLAAHKASGLAAWGMLTFCVLALVASAPELFSRTSIFDVNPNFCGALRELYAMG
jgi:hypothetical protein